jgi:segregation and condensation protein B
MTVSIDAKSIVEALIFVSDEPLSPSRLAEIVGDSDARKVRALIDEINAEYEQENRPFRIEELAGGFQVLSRPEYKKWLLQLVRSKDSARLSQATLETLAIVAYKQPVTRAEIETIRGVQAGELLRSLLERGLVRIAGRSEALGRPLLYGTTKKFLDVFGLRSLKDLPSLDEVNK